MTPLKWYEQIWISFQFAPFDWKLKFAIEPYWGHAGFTVGPVSLTIGFPVVQP